VALFLREGGLIRSEYSIIPTKKQNKSGYKQKFFW